MSCEAPERGLVPFLAAGTLDPRERDRAVSHARACAECGDELRGSRELVSGLRAVHLTSDEVAAAAGDGTRPAHLDDCPACAAEVALLARVNAEMAAAAVSAFPGPAAPRRRPLADLLRSARVTLPALAALLIVSLTLGLRVDHLADENRHLSSGAADAARAGHERDEALRANAALTAELQRLSEPQVNAPIANLEPAGGVRGQGLEGREPEVSSSASSVTLVLHLVEHTPARSYAVEVLDGNGGAVWQGGGLVKDAFGTLRLGMPLRLLPPGRYRIRVLAVDGGARTPVEAYAFRVR